MSTDAGSGSGSGSEGSLFRRVLNKLGFGKDDSKAKPTTPPARPGAGTATGSGTGAGGGGAGTKQHRAGGVSTKDHKHSARQRKYPSFASTAGTNLNPIATANSVAGATPKNTAQSASQPPRSAPATPASATSDSSELMKLLDSFRTSSLSASPTAPRPPPSARKHRRRLEHFPPPPTIPGAFSSTPLGSGKAERRQQAQNENFSQKPARSRGPRVRPSASEPGLGVHVRTLTDADDCLPPEATAADPYSIPSGIMQIVPTPPDRNVPVPLLAPPIRKLLFTPERRLLRKELLTDPNSGASIPSTYTSIEPTDKVNMGIFPPFVTSSRDTALFNVAFKNRCKIMGSTSSMTALLSHLQFLFTGFRPVDTKSVNSTFKSFEAMSDRFTGATRKPATVLLRRRDRAFEDPSGMIAPFPIWGIDNPPSGDPLPNQVLVDLGKIMERWFTLEPEAFRDRVLKDRQSPTNPQPQDPHEASLFVKMNNIMMRSQLDCCDPDMKSQRKVFDLKTRATLPIRLDCSNWKEYTSYGIFKLTGRYNSFEREWYDMARSAFLKFSLQCRIGHMNGVVVAYHNTQQVFGLEYIPLEEMDRITFGTSRGVAKGERDDDDTSSDTKDSKSAPSPTATASNATAADGAATASVKSTNESSGSDRDDSDSTNESDDEFDTVLPANDGAVLAEKSFNRTLRILDDVLNQITTQYSKESCIKVTFFADKGTGLAVYVELLPPLQESRHIVEALHITDPNHAHKFQDDMSDDTPTPSATTPPPLKTMPIEEDVEPLPQPLQRPVTGMTTSTAAAVAAIEAESKQLLAALGGGPITVRGPDGGEFQYDPNQPLDIYSNRYTASLRVDTLTTAQIKEGLIKYGKSTDGSRAELASRLERQLGLTEKMAEAPFEYYRRLADAGYLHKYHIGLTNVLNGKRTKGPFDLLPSDNLQTTYSFQKLDVHPMDMGHEYRAIMVRSRLLHEHEFKTTHKKAGAVATDAEEGQIEVREYVKSRRIAARQTLMEAARDHYEESQAKAARDSL